MKKRIISILLCVLLLVALLPVGVLADEPQQLYFMQYGPDGSFVMQQIGMPCGDVNLMHFAVSNGQDGYTDLDDSWIIWADSGLGSFMWLADMQAFLWNTTTGGVPGASGKVYAQQGPESEVIYAMSANLNAPIAGVYFPEYTGNIATNYCSNNTVHYTSNEGATAYIKLGCPDITGAITGDPVCNTNGVTASLVQGDNTLVKLELAAELSGNVTAEISIPVEKSGPNQEPRLCTVTFTDAEQLYFHPEENSPYMPSLSTDAESKVPMRLFKQFEGQYVALDLSTSNVTATIGEIVEEDQTLFWATGDTAGTGTITVNDDGTLYRMTVEVFPAQNPGQPQYLSFYEDDFLRVWLPTSLEQSEAKFTVMPREGNDDSFRAYDVTTYIAKGTEDNWRKAYDEYNGQDLYLNYAFTLPQGTQSVISMNGNIDGIEDTFAGMVENWAANSYNVGSGTEESNGREIAVVNEALTKAVITPYYQGDHYFLVAGMDGSENIVTYKLYLHFIVDSNFDKVEVATAQKVHPAEGKIQQIEDTNLVTYSYDPDTGYLIIKPADGKTGAEEFLTAVDNGMWTAFTIAAPDGYQTPGGGSSYPIALRTIGPALRDVTSFGDLYFEFVDPSGSSMLEKITVFVEGVTPGFSAYWDPADLTAFPEMERYYDAENGYYHISFDQKVMPDVETLRALDRIEFPAPEGAVWYLQNGTGSKEGTSSILHAEGQVNLFNSMKTNPDAYRSVNDPFIYNLLCLSCYSLDGITAYYNGTPGEMRANLMEWYDADKETKLGSTYIYGVADDFVFETLNPGVAEVNSAVEKPTLETEEDHDLIIREFPQDNAGVYGCYFELELADVPGSVSEPWVIYLPYSYIGVADKAEATRLNLAAPVIHHYNEARSEYETIIGEYTDYGIKFSVASFSPFTITASVAAPTGGDDGGATNYAVTVNESVRGSISADKKSAPSGSTVTLTAEPEKGWTLETLTVLDKDGKSVEIKDLGDNKFSFKMPASAVTVDTTFMEDNTMLNFCVDVKANDYCYDAVLWAYINDICKGTDNVHFSPNVPVTRAQMVTFLWRAAGCPESSATDCKFIDVKADAYYYKAVLWAVEKDVTSGTGASTFSPDAICTRAQVVTFLARFAGVKDADAASVFSDVKSTDYFAAAVKWAKDNGITVGASETTFSPYDDCNRAQAMTFLYRWIVKETST